jgi:hypothetical protein
MIYNVIDALSSLFPDWDIPELEMDDRELRMRCPFCESRYRSASVNLGRGKYGLFHCFSCQVHGNPVSIVRAAKNMTTAEAFDWIAGRCKGISTEAGSRPHTTPTTPPTPRPGPHHFKGGPNTESGDINPGHWDEVAKCLLYGRCHPSLSGLYETEDLPRLPRQAYLPYLGHPRIAIMVVAR